MTDHVKLRELAEGTIRLAGNAGAHSHDQMRAEFAFNAAASPQAVLALLDENKELRERIERIQTAANDDGQRP